jgi:hypothetical protein
MLDLFDWLVFLVSLINYILYGAMFFRELKEDLKRREEK